MAVPALSVLRHRKMAASAVSHSRMESNLAILVPRLPGPRLLPCHESVPAETPHLIGTPQRDEPLENEQSQSGLGLLGYLNSEFQTSRMFASLRCSYSDAIVLGNAMLSPTPYSSSSSSAFFSLSALQIKFICSTSLLTTPRLTQCVSPSGGAQASYLAPPRIHGQLPRPWPWLRHRPRGDLPTKRSSSLPS